MRKILLAVALLAICSLAAAQQSLNNEAIIKLAKAGLSDDVIITTINASSGAYDTSASGLVGLKEAGVSDKVITAIVKRASASAPSAPSAEPQPTSVPQNPASTARADSAPGQPRIFIKADPDFGVAIAAAMDKKHVPATLVTEQQAADYVLQSATVNAKQESGGSKVARCLFASCAGIEGSSSVSVQLIRPDGSIAWAYQVRKANGGPVGIQSLSEAIAKHLKNDFLDKGEK